MLFSHFFFFLLAKWASLPPLINAVAGSLKVINDGSTLCSRLTHQSVTMTGVCFLPFPSPVCLSFPSLPSAAICSLLDLCLFHFREHHSHFFKVILPVAVGVRQPSPHFARSGSSSLQKSDLILVQITLSLAVTASSHPVPPPPLLPKASRVRRVIGQMCFSTVDERQSLS